MGEFDLCVLVNADSEPQAGLIVSALREAGIPFFEKRRGAGAFYSMSQMFGVDIYVSRADLERATELLNRIMSVNMSDGLKIYSIPEGMRSRRRLRGRRGL